MKKTILIFFLLFTVLVNSQTETIRHNNIQTDFFFGRPIEHDKKLKDAIDGNSYGVLLSYNTINTKKHYFQQTLQLSRKRFFFFISEL